MKRLSQKPSPLKREPEDIVNYDKKHADFDALVEKEKKDKITTARQVLVMQGLGKEQVEEAVANVEKNYKMSPELSTIKLARDKAIEIATALQESNLIPKNANGNEKNIIVGVKDRYVSVPISEAEKKKNPDKKFMSVVSTIEDETGNKRNELSGVIRISNADGVSLNIFTSEQGEIIDDPQVVKWNDKKMEFSARGSWIYSDQKVPEDLKKIFECLNDREILKVERGGFSVPDTPLGQFYNAYKDYFESSEVANLVEVTEKTKIDGKWVDRLDTEGNPVVTQKPDLYIRYQNGKKGADGKEYDPYCIISYRSNSNIQYNLSEDKAQQRYISVTDFTRDKDGNLYTEDGSRPEKYTNGVYRIPLKSIEDLEANAGSFDQPVAQAILEFNFDLPDEEMDRLLNIMTGKDPVIANEQANVMDEYEDILSEEDYEEIDSFDEDSVPF